MTRRGLPVCLHGPFRFLLERRTPGGEYGPLDRVEALREGLARQDGALGTFRETRPGGAPPTPTWRPDEARPAVRSLSDIAHVASVTAVWGTFLYLCATAARARTVLELGTAAGISGCYLASAPSCRRFITVEGDAGRARLAATHLRQFNANVEVVNASFEAAIERLLPSLPDGIDLAFIDGDKTKGAYLALLDRLSPRLNPGALVLFDDIQWFDAQEDWKALSARRGLSFVVNAGRFGVCVWDGIAARPQTFTLYGLAGVDIYKVRRDLTAYLGR